MKKYTRHLLSSAAAAALWTGLCVSSASAQQAQPGTTPNAPIVAPGGSVAGPVAGPITGPITLEPARQAALTERLTILLSGYEYFPDRAKLDSEGAPAEVITVLLQLLDNTNERSTLRIKAIDALGLYKEPVVAERLRVLAMSAPSSSLPVPELRLADSMRHHAIVAIARSGGAEAVETLKPLLRDADLQIQLTAVSALGKHGGEQGRAQLTQLKQETSDLILLRELNKHVR